MKTPMHAMSEIIGGMAMKACPQAKELLKISAITLRTREETLIKEAYQAGRNDISGSSPEVSTRKATEYFNKKFEE